MLVGRDWDPGGEDEVGARYLLYRKPGKPQVPVTTKPFAGEKWSVHWTRWVFVDERGLRGWDCHV